MAHARVHLPPAHLTPRTRAVLDASVIIPAGCLKAYCIPEYVLLDVKSARVKHYRAVTPVFVQHRQDTISQDER